MGHFPFFKDFRFGCISDFLFYGTGIMDDFPTPGIYFPRRRRHKLYPEGPREGEVVKPTRPWNDTAGQHYAKFITNCSSPLTMILLDDSITGDNGRGKMEGNRVLDFYARRSDTMVLRGDLSGYFYPLLFFSPFFRKRIQILESKAQLTQTPIVYEGSPFDKSSPNRRLGTRISFFRS